jgi:dTDP-4-amino-4,6-dideoxygalactose transaminase
VNGSIRGLFGDAAFIGVDIRAGRGVDVVADGATWQPAEPVDCDISWFVFVVRLAEGFTIEPRDRILRQMQSQNIQVGNYFAPVHLMPFIAGKFGHKPGDFPIAESASARVIALPFHNHLTKDQVDIVCTALKQLLAI